ncbi:DUF6596 domain-containing protein, partial [Ramlibacter sp.]|uniref:DUF6596 domain-containing protein n=1 Tax=Ramlibacter sp. TaxID=1917967 RepID=UPI0025CCE06B
PRRSRASAIGCATEEPEARGLLALMLLNHARLPARLDLEGRIGRRPRRRAGKTRRRVDSHPRRSMYG